MLTKKPLFIGRTYMQASIAECDMRIRGAKIHARVQPVLDPRGVAWPSGLRR
jgi:hypothetical protein